MTTELKRFTEAYATMTVAAYEPLILRWISLIGIRFISNAVAYRLPKAAAIRFDGKTPAALALSKTLRKSLPAQIDFEFRGQETRVPIDIHGRAITPEAIQKVEVPNFPNAVAIGKDVYLNGFSITNPAHLTGEQGPSVGEATPAGMVGASGTAAPAAAETRFNSFTQGSVERGRTR